MRKYFFVIYFFLSYSFAQSQTLSATTYDDPMFFSIRCQYYDTVAGIIYVGGDFTDIGGVPRNRLAAYDVETGALLSWNPNVPNGCVYSIVKYGNDLYVGGSFTGFSGKNYIAKIFTASGLVDATFTITANNTVRALSVYINNLYIAGEFSIINSQTRNYLAKYQFGSGLTSWTHGTTAPGDVITKIYSDAFRVYCLKDVFGTPNLVYEIVSVATGNTVKYYDAQNGEISDFAVSTATGRTYIVGSFTLLGDGTSTYTKNYAASFFNAGTMQTWNPGLMDIGTAVAYFRDTVFIAQYNVAGDYSSFKSYDWLTATYFSDLTIPANYRITQQQNTIPTCFWQYKYLFGAKDKLFCLRSCGFANNSKTLKKYCFKPYAPLPFITSKASVCAGDTASYYLPVESNLQNYNWSYSGSGVSISNLGITGALLTFSDNASSGTLSVTANSFCGLESYPRTFSITVIPKPNANAGSDRNITCDSSLIPITGTSFTSGAAFQWNVPLGPNQNGASVNADSLGNYILIVTEPILGCKNTDTLMLRIDTVKPIINLPTGPFQLTCLLDSVLLFGNSNNFADSIKWITPTGTIFSDSIYANTFGSYAFWAKNSVNGCVNLETIVVTVNDTVPVFTMPAMDTVSLYSLTTITCDTPWVNLNAVSGNTSVILYWDDLNTALNDSLQDPLTVNTTQALTCYAYNTVNGCVSSGTIFTQVDTTKPGLSPLADTSFINCSANTIVLNADSNNVAGSTLSWTGPGSFLSSDPAIVTQAGNYFVKSLLASNGCSRKDSVFVQLVQTLTISAGNDTMICPGTNANFSVNIIGGTGPFAYSWSNASTSASATFSPTDTSQYSVMVTDINNCVGKDTVIVLVPDPINDSIKTFKPCDAGNPNGQINIYAYGGIPSYQFSIDTGNTFQSSLAFTNLNYGNYLIIVRDTMGCTFSSLTSINQQSASFSADFLVATNSFEDSVLVLVDICNPRPDSIWWEVPLNASLFGPDSSGTQYYLNATDTGAYSIVMHAIFGLCEDTDTSYINLLQWDTLYASPLNNGIDSLNAFPNPAPGGQFSLYVKLNKKETFSIYIYNAIATGIGQEIWNQSVYENDVFSGFISLPSSAVSGTYLLRVVSEYDSEYLILVIP